MLRLTGGYEQLFHTAKFAEPGFSGDPDESRSMSDPRSRTGASEQHRRYRSRKSRPFGIWQTLCFTVKFLAIDRRKRNLSCGPRSPKIESVRETVHTHRSASLAPTSRPTDRVPCGGRCMQRSICWRLVGDFACQIGPEAASRISMERSSSSWRMANRESNSNTVISGPT